MMIIVTVFICVYWYVTAAVTTSSKMCSPTMVSSSNGMWAMSNHDVLKCKWVVSGGLSIIADQN